MPLLVPKEADELLQFTTVTKDYYMGQQRTIVSTVTASTTDTTVRTYFLKLSSNEKEKSRCDT